jgi:two-component system, LytTR family, response regulator
MSELNSEITALIVDDEINARRSLSGVLNAYFPNVKILAEAKDVPEAVKAIHKFQPQVVFLDIEMPGYSGLSILEFFNKNTINFKIIFVTAYSEYAINAFELSAVDYILKPIRKESLERALSKIDIQEDKQLEVLQETLNFKDDVSKYNKKIVLSTSKGLLFTQLDDIIYLKADGSYTHIYFKDQSRVTTTKRISEYEKLEEIGDFMRIHRSHIININHISKIIKQDGGQVEMINGEELSISNEKKSQLMDMIKYERI